MTKLGMTKALTPERTEAEKALIAAFDSGARPDGASLLRRQAMALFSRMGLPNRRVEAWHYTDLRAALRNAAPLRAQQEESFVRAKNWLAADASLDDVRKFVVCDGVFRPDLSDMENPPEGLQVSSLAAELAAGDPALLEMLTAQGQGGADAVVALNTALMQDGVVLRVAPDVQLEKPLALIHLTTGDAPQAHFSRSLCIVGDRAQLKLIEITAACAKGAAQANEALILQVGADAKIDHMARVAHRQAQSLALHSLFITMGARAHVASFCFVNENGLTRRQIFAQMRGEYAHLRLSGLSLLREKQHADTTLVVDHAAPHGVSREFFRAILDDEAVGVYQGKVAVRAGAQKTDGSMKSQAIMLSDLATMNNKPELEIFADDVTCGHGATVGQLDDEQIFYLQSRGFPRAEAEALLLEAFAQEALEGIADENWREKFACLTQDWLKTRSRR